MTTGSVQSLTHDLRSKITDEGFRPEVIVLLPLLKRPKLEIFGGVFIQIRPVWIGDLGTRQNNSKYR
jgi:hypothetical protein